MAGSGNAGVASGGESRQSRDHLGNAVEAWQARPGESEQSVAGHYMAMQGNAGDAGLGKASLGAAQGG